MLVLLKEDELGGTVPKSALLPIDLEKLVLSLGARIIRVEELGGVRLSNPWAERDTKVPGLFDRFSRTIIVGGKEPLVQQRFTVAHEIGHLLFHSKPVQLRERAARGNLSPSAKPSIDQVNTKAEEREAEIFAAELLMPAEQTEEAMVQRFGGPIDGTLPHDDLAYFLSLATRQRLEPRWLARMPQKDRARLFAQADNFRGTYFEPLTIAFNVSEEAMAIRLLELGLVT